MGDHPMFSDRTLLVPSRSPATHMSFLFAWHVPTALRSPGAFQSTVLWSLLVVSGETNRPCFASPWVDSQVALGMKAPRRTPPRMRIPRTSQGVDKVVAAEAGGDTRDH